MESIRTHFQKKLNAKRLPTQYALRPVPDPLVVVVDQGWGNPSFDEELYREEDTMEPCGRVTTEECLTS